MPAGWVLAEARAGRNVRLGRYERFVADELEAWWLARLQGPVRQYATGEPANVRGRGCNRPPRGPQETQLP